MPDVVTPSGDIIAGGRYVVTFDGSNTAKLTIELGETTNSINKLYSARELLRRTAEPGPYHNFPESFNSVIFENGTKFVTPDYYNIPKQGYSSTGIKYVLSGTVNSKQGVYEIGTRLSLSGRTELIWHRFFKPIK